MSELSKREQEIITALYRAKDFVSAEEIAELLKVSTKTVYREVKDISAKLEQNVTIEKCPGKGFRLKQMVEGTSREAAASAKLMDMSISERRRHQMVLMLLQSPKKISINKLSACYYISTASIVNDLKYIKQIVGAHGLQLVSEHDGTCIQGAEEKVRGLLMEVLGYSQEFFRENLHINRETYHVLFQEFSQKDIHFVEGIMEEMEENLHEEIRDPYYINIFTHLLILMKRINCDQEIEWTEERNAPAGEENGVVAQAADRIVRRLEDYLRVRMPAKEREYIYQYLVSSRIEDQEVIRLMDDKKASPRETEFVQLLVRRVSEALGISLEEDENLRTSLYLHIHPMAKRVRYKLSVHNPLLQDIRKEFSEVFEAVSAAVKEQKIFPAFAAISDDEIAYIAVYFQAAFEKYAARKRVLLVCSSGVGTSHLLGARVKRIFPDWEIVDIVSAARVDEAIQRCQPMLVLTTVHIEVQQVPTILVSAVLSKYDIAKLKSLFSPGGGV